MKRFAIVSGLMLAAFQAHAVVWGFSAPILTGLQEVPANNSPAYGAGSFTIDTDTWQITGSMNVNDILYGNNTVVGAHIHEAPVGVNGPVRYNILTNQVPGSPIIIGDDMIVAWQSVIGGTATDRQNLLNAMIAGNTYINVHSDAFPGGEVRGQVECTGVVPEPASMIALGIGAIATLARKRRKS